MFELLGFVVFGVVSVLFSSLVVFIFTTVCISVLVFLSGFFRGFSF